MTALPAEVEQLLASAAEHKRLARFHRRAAARDWERLRKKLAEYGISLRVVSGRAQEAEPDDDHPADQV